MSTEEVSHFIKAFEGVVNDNIEEDNLNQQPPLEGALGVDEAELNEMFNEWMLEMPKVDAKREFRKVTSLLNVPGQDVVIEGTLTI